jgi:hypothetical protein
LAINDKNYLALSIIEQCCVAKKLCAKYAWVCFNFNRFSANYIKNTW